MTFDSNFGSSTARAGFQNEKDVVCILNDWRNNNLAVLWLERIGYQVSLIKNVRAEVISRCKIDVAIDILDVEGTHKHGFQVKLFSNPRGYNQIDKRWVDEYARLWQIPKDVVQLLKLFTGEIKPLCGRRRLFLTDLKNDEQQMLISFLTQERQRILNTLFLGIEGQQPDWYLVIQKNTGQDRWSLTPINEIMDFYGLGDIIITQRGSLHIGRITMQRKGGDGGRPSANMLQFKINPAEIM